MKKALLSLAFAAFAQLGAWAQATTTYTFRNATATYTNLASPTVLTVAGWDDETFDIALGFNFTIGNVTNDSITFDTYGDFVLSNNSGSDFKLVTAYEADLLDRGTTSTSPSQVGYEISGPAGSRILKVEFRNVGFYDNSGPIANAFANFQVWFREGSNRIDMHYGSSSVPAAALGNFISGTGSSHGIAETLNTTSGAVTGPFLTGAPANPTMAATNVPYNTSIQYWVWPSINGVPGDGAMYSFLANGVTGVAKNMEHINVSVYPNPVVDELRIKGFANAKENVIVNVYDVLGKVVLTQEMKAAAVMPVNVSNLTKGTYFMEIISGNDRAGQQVIKL